MGLGQFMAKELIREIGNRSREFYEFVMPAVDIYEDGSDLVVLIDLPGFQKKDINIKISKNILSIRAQRTVVDEVSVVYFNQRPKKIDKEVPLPIDLTDEENVSTKAEYVDGVVSLRIPIPKTSNISIS
ncbi:MAG TPA: archaeal heat shock protein Hsp14 [Nitrososphaeraceae archaeon]